MHVFKQWPMYFIGRILPAAIAFFGIAAYTRLLDPTSFGIYALLLSTSYLVGLLCFSWLRVAALRMMASVPAEEDADFTRTIAVAFLAMSLVVGCAIVAVLLLYRMHLTSLTLVLAAVTAIVSGWFELNVSIAQARLHLVLYSVLQSAKAIASVTGTLLLIHFGWTVDALLGGFILGNCVSFAALGNWRHALAGTFRRDVFRKMFLFGWPASASSMSSLSGTFQRFSLQTFGGTAALGIFAAVGDFANQTVGLLIGTASLAGQPLAFRARDRGTPGELEAQLRNNARLVFAIGAGATAGLIALAQPLADVYFGPKFRVDAGPLIIIFALSALLGGLRSSYFEQGFEIMLKTRPIAILTALRIVVYIALSIILIPRIGAIGAADASLISEFLLLVVTIVWSRSLLHMPVPIVSFMKMTVASLVMAGCIQLVPDREHIGGLGLAVVVGIFVYGVVAALLYFGEVKKQVAIRMKRSHSVASGVAGS